MAPLNKPKKGMARALPKPAMPVYSTTMDALACHIDGSIRAALGSFVQAFALPSHGTHLREALTRLDEGLALLCMHAQEAKSLIDHARQSLATLRCAVDSIEDASRLEQPIKQWATQHVQYAALLRIPDDDAISHVGLAAAYLDSLINSKPISKQFCKAVTGAARSSNDAMDTASDDQRSWYATHEKHVDTLRREGLDQGTLETGDFQRDACYSFIWRAKLPGKNVRLGLPDSRSLGLDAFKQVAGELREGLLHGDEVAIGVAAGWWSGLTWPLAKRIPVMEPDDSEWVIWLDPARGCYHVNLTPIARNAAVANGNTNYIAATKVYARRLPAQLTQALCRLVENRPHATTLGELTGTLDVPEEHAVGPSSDRVLKTSIARLYNSRSAVSRTLGLSAPLAALVLGEFGRGAHSRLYYQAISSQKLDCGLDRVADLLDWGPIPSAPADPVAIGANVVPHAAAIGAIAAELALQVEALRPPRRHTWQRLRNHHNAYARFTAFLVSLGIMGRQRNATVIVGGRWAAQSGLSGVHDKPTQSSLGATSVAMCRAVCDQMDHWMIHLACLRDRMVRLGVEAASLIARIDAILSGENLSLVFTIDDSDQPHDCGSSHAYQAVPDSLRVKADSSRHLWEHYFTSAGISDMMANAQSRRTVRWAPYWNQTSTLSGARLRVVVGSLQDRVLDELGIHAIRGLRK